MKEAHGYSEGAAETINSYGNIQWRYSQQIWTLCLKKSIVKKIEAREEVKN